MQRWPKHRLSLFRLLYSRSNRSFSTAKPGIPNPLVLQVWGANTGVGKTVLSTALLRTAEQPSLYLKPVQTGPSLAADALLVSKVAPDARAVTLHSYNQPVSPDLAASLDDIQPPTDASLCEQTAHGLGQFLETINILNNHTRALALVETAGGALSPVPSGALQADAYRSLNLPALLVGDPTLGGISTTLAAYEALRIRGYDVSTIVFFANILQDNVQLENEVSVKRVVEKDGISVFQAPAIPPIDVPLIEYCQTPAVSDFFTNLSEHLYDVQEKRFRNLKHMQERASDIFWYPFTQHTSLGSVTCIDSASGDMLSCYDQTNGLHEMVDGIGSWWTNGVGHGNAEMAKAMGRACGRYGHVMFPEATNAPAFELASSLLSGVGQGWADRVFYSDNGSTAVEVALKMAFRKRARDFPEHTGKPVKIVAIDGGYHGDTLGVMDCATESVYNEQQTPWFESRGVFFEAPTASLVDGVWQVHMPEWTGANYDIILSGRGELMDRNRDVPVYSSKIKERLDTAEASGVEFGALLIEPVLQGAGGMRLIDPAFQRALVAECRARGVPVIFDEVFTGLWRLGSESGAGLLGVQPDVGVFAKLLTGGTVPLAATLASKEVFKAFDGEGKAEALLHGHSYTAHASGCAAGVEAMRQYEGLKGDREYWDLATARELSCADEVEEVVVLGTVLGLKIRGDGEGYGATGAKKVIDRLQQEGVFSRPLGNVVYIMSTPLTDRAWCDEVMKKVHRVLTNGSERTSKRAEA
ncbi:unnamed protein product [Chondrus crispus]|uniref:Uncharacterized protein n=1 Tax=Chondrus crispus TaxID=2769 RepID=R7Q5Z5_CHOCR|nr:unnamed protein product [Chondrus crispus]CDF33434.1 unnamed protein product [Chondrus crispus]|eukprot:XP_005713237.1 unnamed protein product [Chondrus crispus]